MLFIACMCCSRNTEKFFYVDICYMFSCTVSLQSVIAVNHYYSGWKSGCTTVILEWKRMADIRWGSMATRDFCVALGYASLSGLSCKKGYKGQNETHTQSHKIRGIVWQSVNEHCNNFSSFTV